MISELTDTWDPDSEDREWTTPVQIDSFSGTNNARPVIVFSEDNVRYIAYIKEDQGTNEVCVKRGEILQCNSLPNSQDAEWVDIWQNFAAHQYLSYLLSEDTQKVSQNHGFRPANPSVPLDKDLFSPQNGVLYELDVPVLKAPSGEVLEALFSAWSKVRHE